MRRKLAEFSFNRSRQQTFMPKLLTPVLWDFCYRDMAVKCWRTENTNDSSIAAIFR